MISTKNATQSFYIAEIQLDIAVKSHRGNPRNRAGPLYKEGAAREDERPKSREETPKVGYDTSAKPNVPHTGIWARSWCSATATIGLRMHFGTHVAHLHPSRTNPALAGDVLIVRPWHAGLSPRGPVP